MYANKNLLSQKVNPLAELEKSHELIFSSDLESRPQDMLKQIELHRALSGQISQKKLTAKELSRFSQVNARGKVNALETQAKKALEVAARLEAEVNANANVEANAAEVHHVNVVPPHVSPSLFMAFFLDSRVQAVCAALLLTGLIALSLNPVGFAALAVKAAVVVGGAGLLTAGFCYFSQKKSMNVPSPAAGSVIEP